jgi:hypothetical protein
VLNRWTDVGVVGTTSGGIPRSAWRRRQWPWVVDALSGSLPCPISASNRQFLGSPLVYILGPSRASHVGGMVIRSGEVAASRGSRVRVSRPSRVSRIPATRNQPWPRRNAVIKSVSDRDECRDCVRNTTTSALPSKLVSVMLSCRCPAAILPDRAIICAKPHDDRRGPSDASRSSFGADTFPARLQRDILFSCCSFAHARLSIRAC